MALVVKSEHFQAAFYFIFFVLSDSLVIQHCWSSHFLYLMDESISMPFSLASNYLLGPAATPCFCFNG
jgi:hypothetical protein